MTRPGVFITFDVECSMGGAWRDPNLKPIPPRRGMMGEYGNQAFGLPLICDILDRYDLKATFFLEPFNDELGHPGETEPICQFLIARGQDVQLHIHPNHVHYGMHTKGQPYTRTDNIAELPAERQRDMVAAGAERLRRWTGVSPIAFRAGNMGASEQTLPILKESGIWIDSSYTFPYTGGQCFFSPVEPYNGSRWYGDVLEVALSGFRQTPFPALLRPAQPLDLMGASFTECRDATSMICDAGADAVAILHSFSLFKVRDIQYNGGRPNRVVTTRFKRYCEWLATNRELYPARTFSEMGRMVREQGYEPGAVAPCLLRKPLRAICRKVQQALNNLYWY